MCSASSAGWWRAFKSRSSASRGSTHIDLFWKGTLLVEHKSFGQDLGKAQSQAFQYLQDLLNEGRFLQILTLAEGKMVKIRPRHDPACEVTVERLQAVLIPAGIGPYEVINLHEGTCTGVIIRLKDA